MEEYSNRSQWKIEFVHKIIFWNNADQQCCHEIFHDLKIT